MPKRKEAIKYARVGEKDLWHPLGLQTLNANSFVKVTNKILRGRFGLIYRYEDSSVEGQATSA